MNKRLLKRIGIMVSGMLIVGSIILMTNRTLEFGKNEVYDMDEVSWFCDVIFWKPPEWTENTETIMGKISQETGLVFDLDVPDEDSEQKLKLMLINNELPDIISVKNETMMHQLTDSNKVWRMDEFLKKYDPQSPLLSEFPKDIKELIEERDGGWYAIPSHMDSSDSRKIYKQCDEYYNNSIYCQENLGIIFNLEIMEKLGISNEDLLTEDQVIAAFEIIKKSGLKLNGEEAIPVLIDGGDYQKFTLGALEYTFGAVPIDTNGNYQNILLNNETEHALAFLNLLVRKGYLQIEQFNWDNGEIKEVMSEKRAFCFIGNTANSGMDGFSWVSKGPILSSKGTNPVLPKNLHATGGWINTYISKDCKEPEKIAKWLSYMSSNEGRLLAYFGVEGEDYKRDEKEQVVSTEKGEKDIENYQETGLSAWWPFANIAWNRSVAAPPSKNSEEYGNNMVQFALGKYSETRFYDSTLVQFPKNALDSYPQLMKVKEDIENYNKEAITKIIVSKDEASYKNEYAVFINKLKSLGISDLDYVYNKIYKKNCEKYGTSISELLDYQSMVEEIEN